jgi:nitrate/nitrite-specific signal transduction histidine kinase
MNKQTLKDLRRRAFRFTLSKKILLGFLLAVVIALAAFHWLPPIPAVLAVLVVAGVIYLLINRYLVKPIQALTLAVIESRPTPEGFEYASPEIHTGDELELLADALQRMAGDKNGKD